VEGGKETPCRHRERHARGAATLLAQQRQREHVLSRHSVRHLQARYSEREFLHGLLARGGIALRLHFRRKGLLVGPAQDQPFQTRGIGSMRRPTLAWPRS